MATITGAQTTYLMVQTNTETQDQQAVFYNPYNGTLTPTPDLNNATPFDDLETVQAIVGFQNQMATFLKQKFSYSVVKQEITRTVVA